MHYRYSESASQLSCLIAWFLIGLQPACCVGQDVEANNSKLETQVESALVKAPSEWTNRQLEFFEIKIRPLLVENCYECHSGDAKKLKGGLRLDSRAALLQGGESGAALDLQANESSILLSAVRYEDFEMPPRGKLSDAAIADLKTWIAWGAPWPKESLPSEKPTSPANEIDIVARKANHWMWQPVTSPAIPQVAESSWSNHPVDQFILSKLEAAQLRPTQDADPYAMIRRLYFDLVGLPPTPDQVRSFVANPTSENWSNVVDELLSSPRFGERWGRHWLDLVRYAESRGHEFDNDSENAYQYRDYVIRALNADVPYNQFVREHIAGDLLTAPRLNPEHGFNESILATGFWFLGEWVHSPVDIRKDETDRFDNMLDVLSKTFLGVTLACARCHDHKFDAITSSDYYAMCGYLQSSDYRQVRFESLEHNRAVAAELHALDSGLAQHLAELIQLPPMRARLLLPSDGVPISELDEKITDKFLVDYEHLDPHEFMQDGFIFGDGPILPGSIQFRTLADGPSWELARTGGASNDPLWDGLKSISEKGVDTKSRLSSLPRSGRTLRSPTFTVTDGQLDCLCEGQGHVFTCVDSHRLIAGPLHGETLERVDGQKAWTRLNLTRYVGHRVHLEFTPDEDKTLSVALVASGLNETEKAAIIARRDAVAKEIDFAQEQSRKLVQNSLELKRQVDSLLSQWDQRRRELKSRIMLTSRLAMAMMDGTPENDHLLIRGSSSNPGVEVPRHFLQALCSGTQPTSDEGSGRLQLADQIVSNSNPLTARVIVNRVWHHLFGRGIVPTVDDFGVLGQPPSHPELLDHLASWFQQDGQSIKRLIK
ncbi:MAG: PSD1 domain-containing protein, partial [Planctomycetales bacterium]|nr:PSD1 domain-containing protein [Planctomycetales bacterium]